MAGSYAVQIQSVPTGAADDAVPLSEVVLQHHRADAIRIDAQPLSGGHLLHLAVAGCIFNDLYYVAAQRGIQLTDVCVSAMGGFEGEATTVSTGMSYRVAVTGNASEEELRDLVTEVDRIASIPDVLRRANTVVLSDVTVQAGS